MSELLEIFDVTMLIRFPCPETGRMASVTTIGKTQPFRTNPDGRSVAQLPCPECHDMHFVVADAKPGSFTTRV